MKVLGYLSLVVLTALVPRPSAAQSLPELSLEELMRLDAGRVSGASERQQPVTEAPASVSFITAEEIARFGYRTLADILRSVRGLHVTDDRNFSLVGARGFGRPGDYNSRILLLVNGHRVNDNVFGQAEIGAELGLDPATFERVEIIRGPASSLYGDSAFFAVINIITKSGGAFDGSTVAVETGSLGAARARTSLGRRLAGNLEVAMSATVEHSTGNKRLYFPAFDAPETNDGVAEGLDGEGLGQFYSQIKKSSFTFTGTYGRRRRDVPTASFGSRFNAHDPNQETTDRHWLADLQFEHPLGNGRVSTRAAYDRFTYDGLYPSPDTLDDGSPLVLRNDVVGARWSVGGTITQPLAGRQVVTVGAEFIDNLRQDQRVSYGTPPVTVLAIGRSSRQHALFVQDEVRPTSWLLLSGGLRYDRYERFNRVSPRTAIIVTPSPTQSFKYLYGRAFRAPNEYELNDFYFGERTLDLHPESIDTHEVVWERYTNDWLRTSVSSYWYDARELITLVPDATTFLATTFANEGAVHARGLELEAQMRLAAGVQGVVSYALQRAWSAATGATLVNSPSQTAAARLSASGPWPGSSLAMEWRLLGTRPARSGAMLPTTTTTDVTAIAPLGRAFELTASVRNLFDTDVLHAVSDAHLQDAIAQNGRTIRIGVAWHWRAR